MMHSLSTRVKKCFFFFFLLNQRARCINCFLTVLHSALIYDAGKYCTGVFEWNRHFPQWKIQMFKGENFEYARLCLLVFPSGDELICSTDVLRYGL